MFLQRYFRAALGASIILMALSAPVGAGSYDTEMKNMATAIAASFDQQQVKTIAVLDFTDLQGTVTELGRFLAEELSTNLVIGKKQFDVIDRANLNRLLDENKLSRSGLVDPENIKRLGKIAGANAIVTGTVTPLGSSLRISAKVINTETAKIVGAAKGDVEKTPEISELLRSRVVDTRGSLSSGTATKPANSDREVSPRKVKLTHENPKRFRATVDSASFDKSSNQITVSIDLINLNGFGEKICLAGAGNDSVLAIDEFAGQWNLVKMFGLRKGETFSFNNNPSENEAAKARVENSYTIVPDKASHRFAIVLAPTKPDSPLTLNITLELLMSFSFNSLSYPCGIYPPPVRVSVGFNGITATQ